MSNDFSTFRRLKRKERMKTIIIIIAQLKWTRNAMEIWKIFCEPLIVCLCFWDFKYLLQLPG